MKNLLAITALFTCLMLVGCGDQPYYLTGDSPYGDIRVDNDETATGVTPPEPTKMLKIKGGCFCLAMRLLAIMPMRPQKPVKMPLECQVLIQPSRLMWRPS